MEQTGSAFRWRKAWLYLAAVTLGFVLPLVAMVLVGRTEWFLNHTSYAGITIVGYGEGLRKQNCEVLVYGDSSAMTGLDPLTLHRITGLSVCNISEGTTIQRVLGTYAPLDNYLAHNSPPKVLLTTWTPTIFLPTQRSLDRFTIEGVWYAWRYGYWRQIFTPAGLNWTMLYITWEWDNLKRSIAQELAGQRPVIHDHRPERRAHLGQWNYPLPPQTHCTKGYYASDVVRSEASVNDFRARYSARGIHVLVDVTPVPDCAPLYDFYVKSLDGLHDNQLERYPIGDFNEGDVHLSPSGTLHYSEQAGAQVLAALHSAAPKADQNR